jgi:glycosyltransferase involved in cell wall biosynthesis
MQSLEQAHPDWDRYVLLLDGLPRGLKPSAECFRVVDASQLDIPRPRQFFYRYNLVEASTAVKPWLLRLLFHQGRADRVVYMDPDICVYRPLRHVEALLSDGALMVLTPHLIGRLDDASKPREHDILQAGCYNLGFLALQKRPALEDFLDWWRGKLEFHCRIDFAANLFVDQRWMDLAPGLFPAVAVLRDPGYNVAYWNVGARAVSHDGAGWRAADAELAFYHFSGLNPLAPESLSCHQDRFTLGDLGPLQQLVHDYCDRLRRNGLQRWRTAPYGFGALSDGTLIADCMRSFYCASEEAQVRAGPDPFRRRHNYLNESAVADGGVLVTKLMSHVWEASRDVQRGFPNPMASCSSGDPGTRRAFAVWYVRVFAPRAGLAERFVAPVRAALARADRAAAAGPALRPATEGASAVLRGLVRTTLRLPAWALPAVFQPDREARPAWAAAVRRWARILPRGLRARLNACAGPRRDDRAGIDPAQDASPVTPAEPVILTLRAPSPAASDVGENGPAARPTADAARDRVQVRPDGLNIVGYVCSEHGIGESARLCAQSAAAVGLPFSMHDFNVNNNSRTSDARWRHKLAARNAYGVNVIHVNADQTPVAHAHLGPAFFEGRYNIGFWHWELPDFPDAWLDACDLVDEIWAPSLFVLEAVAAKTHKPVVRMPHCVRFDVDPLKDRAYFGLPESPFLFLNMFDTHSVRMRKNPDAAVDAFRRAFPSRRDVHLVLKVNNPASYPDDVRAVLDRLSGMPNVTVLDRIFTRADVYALESACDAFISLHRSEGFGLGLAECMFLGKPVIGTNWSGNRDFMDSTNSCPVDYHVTRLEEDYGPYQRGQVWADPDVDHAAWYMRRLIRREAWRKNLAGRARHTILTQLAPEVVGRQYRDRLAAIGRHRGAFAEPRLAA